ncbi:MAG: aminopeptidase, partial [Bacteroidota bacterium]
MRHLIRTTLGAGLLLGAMSCTEPSQPAAETPEPAPEKTATGTFDQHSYARPDEAAVTHLNLDVTVDFEARVIHGVASYDLTNKTGTNQLVLDAKELDIEKVTLNDGRATANFTLGAADAVLGQALTITIDDQTERVNIHYRTSPKAEALQWLEPSMTAGK